MVFATDGLEALEVASTTPFDVVVTDMRMPNMNGAELLESFRKQHPMTARFILSGYADVEDVMRAVPIAHQYLSKPCPPDVLEGAVERALRLKDLMTDERCQRAVGELEALPSLPETYAAVSLALSDQDADVASVADIVESDTAMCVKILQLVNSAFFAMPRTITDITEAATFLGLSTLRDLVLAIEVFRPPAGTEREAAEILAGLQRHATATAGLARLMFDDRDAAATAYSAGLLHDVGYSVYATRLPDRLNAAMQHSAATDTPMYLAERELFGVGHPEIGAYLLGIWGLPLSVIEVVAFHHQPTAIAQDEFSPLGAVHVASVLVDQRTRHRDGNAPRVSGIDRQYLDGLGVLERLPQWEEMADAMIGPPLETE